MDDGQNNGEDVEALVNLNQYDRREGITAVCWDLFFFGGGGR